MRVASICILAYCTISISPACAWGPNGHAIVADVAMQILTDPAKGSPSTVAQINKLLPYAKTLDPATLPVNNLADIASAPDAYRADHSETEQWHFVDIPLPATSYDESRDCHYPPGGGPSKLPELTCIVAKLPYFVSVLRSSTTDLDRGQALAFVVHFVGDIHQPLHTETNNGDRGGNDVKFVWRNDRTANLHGIWDGNILEDNYRLPEPHANKNPNKNYKIDLQPAAQVAKSLDPSKCEGNPSTWAPPGLTNNFSDTVVNWAVESHQLAGAAYSELPTAKSMGWEDKYSAYAEPVIDCQLLRAGTRLAQVLREALS